MSANIEHLPSQTSILHQRILNVHDQLLFECLSIKCMANDLEIALAGDDLELIVLQLAAWLDKILEE